MDRLFGLPYCEMDIDVNKISIEYETEKRWGSYTQTSHYKENIVPQDSLIYILEKMKMIKVLWKAPAIMVHQSYS